MTGVEDKLFQPGSQGYGGCSYRLAREETLYVQYNVQNYIFGVHSLEPCGPQLTTGYICSGGKKEVEGNSKICVKVTGMPERLQCACGTIVYTILTNLCLKLTKRSSINGNFAHFNQHKT